LNKIRYWIWRNYPAGGLFEIDGLREFTKLLCKEVGLILNLPQGSPGVTRNISSIKRHHIQNTLAKKRRTVDKFILLRMDFN